MEPLHIGDPTEIGEYLIRGRMWSSGAVTAFQAEHGSRSVVLLVVKNGPQISNVPEHNNLIRALAESANSDSEDLGVTILSGGSNDQYSFLTYEYPEGESLRERIYRGKLIPAEGAVELQAVTASILDRYSGTRRILITPDTVFVNSTTLVFIGLGAFELLELSAPKGASLGVNSLEWFAPETLNQGVWTTASARYSIAACLFAAAAGSPWVNPIRTMSDLFGRSLNIEKLEANPQLCPLYEWLNVVPEMRVKEVLEDTGESPSTDSVQPTLAVQVPTAQQKRRSSPLLLVGVVGIALIAAVIAIGVNAFSGTSDSETAAIEPTATESATVTPTQDPSEPEIVASPNPQYQVRLNYSSESIPNQAPTDGLRFTFDVCSGDSDWIKQSFQSRVKLQFKRGSSWVDVPSIPQVKRGGRCDADQYNMTISHSVTPPTTIDADGVWSTCLSYRVNLPESGQFKKFSVPFCAFVRQTV